MEDNFKNNIFHPYSLNDLGVNDVAYNREEALIIIDYLSEEVIPVLGGDVYFLENDTPCYTTYTGWSCDREKEENFSNYVKRSCKEAKEYIQHFPTDGGIPLFCIIYETDLTQLGRMFV